MTGDPRYHSTSGNLFGAETVRRERLEAKRAAAAKELVEKTLIVRLGGCGKLAAAVGVSPTMISNWRAGRFKPTTKRMLVLRRLANS